MEKKRPELSVIIPLYNAVKTLDRCLANILNETEISLEIILVNDSSTDETLALCEKYSTKDERVRYVTRSNGGVAAARNTGLAIARGDYVTFVDQDDWIEPKTYCESLRIAWKHRADMVVFSYTKDKGERIERMKNRRKIPFVTESRDKLVEYAFYREEYRGYAAYVWNKVFRLDYLKKYGIIFEDGLRRGDDIVFYSAVAAYGPKTCYIDRDFYHYVQREDSITHTMTADNLDRLGEILIGYSRAMDILSKNGVSKESLDYMRCFYVFHASLLYELAKEYGLSKQCIFFRDEMRRYLQEYKAQNAAYPLRIEKVEGLIGEEL